MSYMPMYSGIRLNDNYQDIRSYMEYAYANDYTINAAYWSEADFDVRMFCGDQQVWDDAYGNAFVAGRKNYSFNRIMRVCNMIGGHQRKNRKSITAIPIENANQQTADQLTKIFFWLNQRENMEEIFSQAFDGAIVTGMNLIELTLDYRSDPISGDIKFVTNKYNSFLIDPYFRNSDLSDCNRIWKRTYMPKAAAVSLLPDHQEQIMSMMSTTGKDGKFIFMPETYNYDMTNLVSYDEFWYRTYRTQKVVVDTQTGESMEWTGDDASLRKFLQEFKTTTLIETTIPTTRLAISVNDHVLWEGPNPLGIDEYPFVPVFGYYMPEVPYFPWRIQGVVRNLRSAQMLFNRQKIIQLDILESQVNSGWLAKEGTFINPQDAFFTGQGKVLWVKKNANLADVQRMQPADIPAGMLEISKSLAQEIQEISGVSEELLGAAADDIPGIRSMLKQSAGLTILQRLFDQADLSLKLLGELCMKVIMTKFTPGKLKRVLGEEPSPEFYNKVFGKYGIAIEEGLNTTTQRQMQLAQLLQMREMGIQIPDTVIIEAATIQNKNQLLEAMKAQQEQAQQLQQQQAQVAMQQQQAQLELTQARAQADIGLYQERSSRVSENYSLAAERISNANKEDEQALLNKIKAIKELDSLDISQLERLVGIANTLKQQERSQQEPTQQAVAQATQSTQSPVAPVAPAGPEQLQPQQPQMNPGMQPF